jgi:hypothetical protein
VRIVDGHQEDWYGIWLHRKTNQNVDSNIAYCAVKNISYFGNDGDMGNSAITYFPNTQQYIDGSPAGVFAGMHRYAPVPLLP